MLLWIVGNNLIHPTKPHWLKLSLAASSSGFTSDLKPHHRPVPTFHVWIQCLISLCLSAVRPIPWPRCPFSRFHCSQISLQLTAEITVSSLPSWAWVGNTLHYRHTNNWYTSTKIFTKDSGRIIKHNRQGSVWQPPPRHTVYFIRTADLYSSHN